MKISHIAVLAILLLVGSVVTMLMKTDQDRKLEIMQDSINKLTQAKLDYRERVSQESAVAPAAPAPALPQPAAPPVPIPVSAPIPAPAPNVAATVPPAPVQPGLGEMVPPPVPTAPAAAPSLAGGTLPPADPNIAARELEVMNQNSTTLKSLIKSVPDDVLNPTALKIRKQPAICKIKEVQEAHGFVVLDSGADVGLAPDTEFAVRRDHMIVGRIKITSVPDGKSSVGDIIAKSVPLGVAIQPSDDIIMFAQ